MPPTSARSFPGPCSAAGTCPARRTSAPASGGGVPRLPIAAGGGRRGVGLLLGADLAARRVVDALQGAVGAPLVEVAPGGAPGGEVLGEEPPLAAGPQDVEDGVDDIPQV